LCLNWYTELKNRDSSNNRAYKRVQESSDDNEAIQKKTSTRSKSKLRYAKHRSTSESLSRNITYDRMNESKEHEHVYGFRA
jgi:ubiquitin C-terminal hydrolase